MKRFDIIDKIGKDFLVANTELGEFSYNKYFTTGKLQKIFDKPNKKYYKTADLKFVDNNVTILIETKKDFLKKLMPAIDQLKAYVSYEKQLSSNNIIAILANVDDDNIMVFLNNVDEESYLFDEKDLQNFEYYARLINRMHSSV